MVIDEFNRILVKGLDIFDVGIEIGYFKSEDKNRLIEKLAKVVDNGIVKDIQGKAIYGVFSSSQQKLSYNVKVYKDQQEALINVLHEMKHALDSSEDFIGFEENGNKRSGVGMNEGATHRAATDLAEIILNIKIPQTIQSSLGIYLSSNLDEYQIEDKMNELLRIALNLTRADFIKLQNEKDGTGLTQLKEMFDKFADFDTFQNALDEIYYIQEETWLDEKGNYLDVEKGPTLEQKERAKKLITICQNEIIKYVEKNNPEKKDEIIGGMIMIDNEGIMKNGEMVRQYDYLEYQKFVMEILKKGGKKIDGKIVYVSGLEDYEWFDYVHEKEPMNQGLCIKKILEDGRVLSAKLYIREGERYYSEDITFDLNGLIYSSESKIETQLEEISNKVGLSECIGNGEEYINLLESQGQNEKATEVRKKYEYFLNNRNRIPEIIEGFHNNTYKSEIELEIERIKKQINSGESIGNMEEAVSKELDDSISYGNVSISYSGFRYTDNNGIAHQDTKVPREIIEEIEEDVRRGKLHLNDKQRKILENAKALNQADYRAVAESIGYEMEETVDDIKMALCNEKEPQEPNRDK